MTETQYPLIEDDSGGERSLWRQVQMRVSKPEPYAHNGLTWRLVAWEWKYNDVSVFYVPDHERTRRVFKLAELGLDQSAHVAFCRGTMPASVYADWLEENVRDFPAVGLALLRGWIDYPGLRDGLRTKIPVV